MPLGGVVVDIDEVPQSTQVIPSADSLRSTLCISGRNHGRKMRQALHVGKNITSTSTSFWDWIKYVLTVYNCNILYQMETHLRLWTFISCNIPVSFKYIYPFFFSNHPQILKPDFPIPLIPFFRHVLGPGINQALTIHSLHQIHRFLQARARLWRFERGYLHHGTRKR